MWIGYGSCMDGIWMGYGRDMDGIWIGYGSAMDRYGYLGVNAIWINVALEFVIFSRKRRRKNLNASRGKLW